MTLMVMKHYIILAIVALQAFFGVHIFANSSQNIVNIELIAEDETLQPGHDASLLMAFTIEPGWHLYGPGSNNINGPPIISWTLPEGIQIGQIQWPQPERFTEGGVTGFGYTGTTYCLIPLQVATTAQSTEYTIKATISWIACSTLCVPGKTDVSLSIMAAAGPPQKSDKCKDIFVKARQGLQQNEAEQKAPVYGVKPQIEAQSWYKRTLTHIQGIFSANFLLILLSAFFGGMLLNIMPCVLPVVSLKVLHFVQLQGQGRGTTVKHGVAFSCGVILCFWILAGAIFVLQMLGTTVGWGFQLQEPLFVAILVIILFILSLSLFGVFEFGTKVASIAAHLDEIAKVGSPIAQVATSPLTSFWSGILATIVATPCTGPLLGSTIGFAATLDPIYSFLVFTCLGIGMAFPYFLLSLFPSLLKWIPRPGRWMVTFKELMGFFLLATIFWLLWVLEAETSNLPLASLFAAFFLMSFGLWVYGTWGGFDRGKMLRAIVKPISFLILLAGVALFLYEVKTAEVVSRPQMPLLLEEPQSRAVIGAEWVPYSATKLAEYRKAHIPVFVDFTAKWCLTCQANSLVLEAASVKEAFIRYGVVKMEADWTNNDEKITKALRALGRNGVPVYALYGKNENDPPTLLPEILTPAMVIEALKEV